MGSGDNNLHGKDKEADNSKDKRVLLGWWIRACDGVRFQDCIRKSGIRSAGDKPGDYPGRVAVARKDCRD